MAEICVYCPKPADGPMLVMGKSMAHSDCVIRKLNELLDPDWEEGDKREPDKIVAIIDPDAEIAPYISYLLGLEGGTELFKNYPDNFNRIMKAISDKLKEAGWRRVVK